MLRLSPVICRIDTPGCSATAAFHQQDLIDSAAAVGVEIPLPTCVRMGIVLVETYTSGVSEDIGSKGHSTDDLDLGRHFVNRSRDQDQPWVLRLR